MKSAKFNTLLAIVVTLICNNLYAQFYNGLQNDFGKNRIQYKQREWQFFRFDKFDVCFYKNGKELAEYVAESANRNFMELETMLDFTMEDRVDFIVYNKQSDFKQSNIGLITTDPNNIGGTAKIVGSKAFIYYEGDHKKLEGQVRAACAELIVNQWLYGGNWRDRVKSSTLLHLPDWYIKGLILYLSNQWDYECEEILRDGIINNRFKRFSSIEGKESVVVGASIWRFIAESYGKEVIPNLIYLSQVSRNVESGISFVLGITIQSLLEEWKAHYYSKYNKINQGTFDIKNTENAKLKRTKKNRIYTQYKTSPDGKNIIYCTNQTGQIKVYLYNKETQKRKRIYKADKKLERITDVSFPVVAWHPTSKIFMLVTEEKGDLFMKTYDLESGKFEDRPPIYQFEKILDLSYSPDGRKLLISAVQQGQTDIFVYNLSSNTAETITKDIYDDLNPRYINKGKEIIFSSNRNTDSLKFKWPQDKNFYKKDFDLYVYDYAGKGKLLRRYTQTQDINELKPMEYDKNSILFLNEELNILSMQIANFDSAIAFVDTIAHYRYFITPSQTVKYSSNLLEYNYNPELKYFNAITYQKGRYRLSDDISILNSSGNLKINNEPKQNSFNKSINEANLKMLPVKKIFSDKSEVKGLDYNNYVFESDKSTGTSKQVQQKVVENTSAKNPPVKQSGEKSAIGSTGENFVMPKQLNYFRYYTIDQFTSQFNNNFVNQTYQKYTGGEVFFNPGINGLVQIGMSDAFEDYRIFGGFKLSADLRSNEFLLGYEDRRLRWDKTYTAYRQSFPSSTAAGAPKILSHVLGYSLRYPFNEVAAFKTTFNYRNDRSVFLSTDLDALVKRTEYDNWISNKSEYIFDNSVQKAINIFNGIRFKVFGEYFNQIDDVSKNLIVIGTDFRYYQKIYKNFIYAFRTAASSSFGSQKLVYYLGSTDNWINLSTRTNTFNRNIPIDQNQNYAFQALATNMRGFNQNIRNGSSFAVMNHELRLPLFTTIYNRPLRSDFLNNFQVIGFFDAGTAWTGISPFDANNEYNSEVISSPPVTVTLKRTRQAIVYGYGWGLRSRLLGYFIRFDWAWGIDDQVRQPRIFYLSLATDF